MYSMHWLWAVYYNIGFRYGEFLICKESLKVYCLFFDIDQFTN